MPHACCRWPSSTSRVARAPSSSALPPICSIASVPPFPARRARLPDRGQVDEASLAQAAGALAAARRPISSPAEAPCNPVPGRRSSSSRGDPVRCSPRRFRPAAGFRASSTTSGSWVRSRPPRRAAGWRQADLIVAIGTTFNAYVQGTAFGDETLATDVQLLQIDTDPAAIGRHLPVAHRLVGDATACVRRSVSGSVAGRVRVGTDRPTPRTRAASARRRAPLRCGASWHRSTRCCRTSGR